MESIINEIEVTLRREWADEPTGHDWEHIRRVRDMALHIQSNEGGDPFLIELGALLHDISDHKFNGGKLNAGGEKAKNWLLELGLENDKADYIADLVDNISFKGAKFEQGVLNLETQIVQDADRLDALGAIGIARAFAFGGNRNQIIYNQNLKPVEHETFAEYASAKTSTINHFYEKLLLLGNKMNTKTGRIIANDRHLFMENYLNQFYSEWNLKKI
jgi:uncharacterized protein